MKTPNFQSRCDGRHLLGIDEDDEHKKKDEEGVCLLEVAVPQSLGDVGRAVAGEKAAHLRRGREETFGDMMSRLCPEKRSGRHSRNFQHTQLMAYESGVIFLVSKKEQSSGSWYCKSSL